MGKSDGFLKYKRIEDSWISPEERIKNFEEFHNHLNDEERRKQASRCMNCGVPMCQSAINLGGMVTGCPLHNFIPEWNDALYKGQYDMAAWSLLKTSSFPEFTGRVCPALCEKACNCGSPVAAGTETEGAVTIHDNELYIIEKAFASGFMKPEIPQIRSDNRIAVIGSGPSGLAVADLLNRRGHNVTVYERDDRIGGLLMYGIPNMKLDKKIIERRIELMKAEGVTFVTNADIGKTIKAQDILTDYDAVALCCGAKKARPLNVKNEDAKGIIFAVDWLKSVTKSLLDKEKTLSEEYNPKGKHVIVVGGGDTGNDCTGSCVRLGAASVTALEMMPCPPSERQENNPWPQWPKVLKTDYGQQEVIETEGHDPRIYKTTIKEIYTGNNGEVCKIKTVQVEFKNIDGQRKLCEIEGSEKELPADMILIAAGFVGCEDYTANAFGVTLGPRGTVVTSGADKYATNVANVFSCGDMHRGQSLVVWAIAEGRACAKEIDKFLMGYTNL
ncbi:MAG: glutamate synthase subunit beta [Sphaerochaetaceae bacterium]|nr:glutamate synthase subunit beta [Sphaerochaetaceae bacterium]